MSDLRLLLGVPTSGALYGDDIRQLVDLAHHAEVAGFDGVVVPDHVVMGERTDRYPWGTFPSPPDKPWPEPLALLGAMGAVTARLKLCTGILIAPLRPAIVLAKTVATLDVLTGGRVELGVGTGWQREEFDAAGLDYERRGALLTSCMESCRALWAPGSASIDTEAGAAGPLWCEPKPVRPGGVPVLFSGTLTRRNLDRILRLGDGWIPIMTATTADIAGGVRLLRALLAEQGRDPEALVIRTRIPLRRAGRSEGEGLPDLDATLAGVPELRAAGVTDLVLPLTPFVRSAADVQPWLEAAVAAWRAAGAP